MPRFSNRFRTLHWQLTFTYTRVMGFIFLFFTVVLPVLLMVVVMITGIYGRMISSVLKPVFLNEAALHFDEPIPDRVGLQALVDRSCTGVYELYFFGFDWSADVDCKEGGVNQIVLPLDYSDAEGADIIRQRDNQGEIPQFGSNSLRFLAIFDAEGTLLALTPPDMDREAFLVDLSRRERMILDLALGQKADGAVKWTANPFQISTTVAEPILAANDDRILGAVLIRVGSPTYSVFDSLENFLLAALAALIIGLPVGIIASYWASRGVVNRLGQVTQAAAAWEQGDFSVTIRDHSLDELGQLAQRLNKMAEQLQNQFEIRSALAALDERNRLARDLHDAAKQQVFATSMQVGTAKALLDVEPEAAKEHLAVAQQLSRQAGQELSGLIRELRPAQLDGTGLFVAIKELIEETFMPQKNMAVKIRLLGERELPFALEQAFFRICQEAFNNIIKHSHASQVIIHLTATAAKLTMTIKDDGVGFDTMQPTDGVGLQSMQERIAGIEGQMHIQSRLGEGTMLEITCPIPSLRGGLGRG